MGNFEHQFQNLEHSPTLDIWGDCHRTACAMVLGVNKELIPNFYQDVSGDGPMGARLFAQFFGDRGIIQVQFAIPGDTDFQLILDSMEAQSPGTPYVLGVGGSQGVGHSVAVKDAVVFDPMGDGKKTYLSCPDGFYWVTFFAAKDPSSLFHPTGA